jgi:hypothetical protein
MRRPQFEICPLKPVFSEDFASARGRRNVLLHPKNESQLPPGIMSGSARTILSSEKELQMKKLSKGSTSSKSLMDSAAVLVVLIALAGTAVGAAHTPERDGAAITTLQNAITALGGANVIGSIQDCVITGSFQYSDGSSKNFNWTIAGSEFRRELDFPNGGSSVFYSGHGSPAWTRNGTTSSVNYYMDRANLPLYLPPYVLYQELNNSIYTLKYVGVVQLNGNNVVQVHVSDDSDATGTLVTPQEWYFDPVSFLPLEVQFREPSNENASDYTNATFVFSPFVSTSGVLAPSTISFSQDNAPNMTITIGSVTFNSGVSQNVFNPPQGGGL